MVYTINWLVLFELILLSSIVCAITLKKARTKIQKIYVLFISISMVIYSGVGNSFKEIGYGYVEKYFVFYICTMVTMVLIFNTNFKKKIINTQRENWNASYTLNKIVMIIFVIMFFLVYFVRLVYPKFQLMNLINPPKPNIIDLFARRDALRSTPLLEIVRLLNLMAMPFFMIYLQRRMEIKKWISVVILIVIWVYLQFVSFGYISRYELVTYAAFILIIIANRNSKIYHLNKKIIFIIVTLFILSLPSLLAYEMLRQGDTVSSKGFLEAALNLFCKETDYPKYYDACVAMHTEGLWSKYLYWFFTLPIPSFMACGLKNNVFLVNQYFTEQFTGILYGSHGYSVLLPSIFGEGIMLYGDKFYWVHGLFIGAFYGIVCRGLEKNPELKLMNLYFAVQMLSIGRGGTPGTIGTIVNSMAMYIIIMKFMELIIAKKRKNNNQTREDII